MGVYVFEMMKDININNKTSYTSNFISAEELKELGKNKKLVTDEKMREEFVSLSIYEWNREIERGYDNIVIYGIEHKINWKSIEFIDYIYEDDITAGILNSDGTLFFKSNGAQYKMGVTSIFDGNEFKLFMLYSFQVI